METKKRTGIILAVLLGFWAWLYTYKKDAWKFWGMVAIYLLGGLFVFWVWNQVAQTLEQPHNPFDDSAAMLAVSGGVTTVFIIGIILAISWLAAVSDTIIKSPQKYDEATPKSRKTAIILSVLLGPLSWLYTYSKDGLNFWISAALIAFNFGLLMPWLNDVYLSYYDFGTRHLIFFIVPTIAWLYPIITNLIRYKNWQYDNPETATS